MTRIKRFFKNSWDEILVYGLTLWCTFISPYLPILADNKKMSFIFDPLAFSVYATVALLLTYVQEYIRLEKNDTEETTAKKKAAKRSHMPRRIIFAMVFGFASPVLLSNILKYFIKLSGLGE